MRIQKLKIYTIGYSDNTWSSYLLNYLIAHGVGIDGAIFPKHHMIHDWNRLLKKYKMRGAISVFKRLYENFAVRKCQISEQCQRHIDNVFYVYDINSERTREILQGNSVELVLLISAIIIKPIIINIEDLTILNVHTGWLPKYRGLDANLKALRDGHNPGVSVHKVTERIDAGEIYLREAFNIDFSGDILKQLDQKELQLAGKLLVEAVRLKSMNMLKSIVLSEPLGKYEPLLKKQERNFIIHALKGTVHSPASKTR